METYRSLYGKMVRACVKGRMDEEFGNLEKLSAYDAHHLDCLLNPEKYPPVIALFECACSGDRKRECENACDFDALTHDENGNAVISGENCVGCGACIDHCIKDNLTDRKDLWPLFELLNKGASPVYALIAPAFSSQFSTDITAGHLRSAFKKIGFTGMIEVALFADILTLKESLEFDRHIFTKEDFLLTSCCCPVWIAMIRKIYHRMVPHIPPSVSPMVACGRAVKALHPEAVTVFIGPCIAKKAEAREKDIEDAVDFVLTFREVQDIFEAAGVRPEEFPEDMRDHSSRAGRIYARTGGVSEAVQLCVKRLRPERPIQVRPRQADGAAACKALLKDIAESPVEANFLEGMGCKGGCVGGPKVIIGREEGAAHVNIYGKEALYETPADNPFVLELLNRLGFHTIDSLLEKEQIFTRRFDT
jgi:iron only hydrogenase large subunit-like protein